jgi:hypothetical protein
MTNNLTVSPYKANQKLGFGGSKFNLAKCTLAGWFFAFFGEKADTVDSAEEVSN